MGSDGGKGAEVAAAGATLGGRRQEAPKHPWDGNQGSSGERQAQRETDHGSSEERQAQRETDHLC